MHIESPEGSTIGSEISVKGTSRCVFHGLDPITQAPVEYDHGNEVVLVIRGRVESVAFPLFDNKYPDDGVVRLHNIKLLDAADVTTLPIRRDLLDLIASQREKQAIEREEAAGIMRIPIDRSPTFEADHDDGLEMDADLTAEIVELNGYRVDTRTGAILSHPSVTTTEG